MGRILNLAAAAVLTAASGAASAQATELPVPCVAGVCGASIPGFVSSGRATATINNNLLRVQQQTDRAILNWASFNVGVDGKVIFDQPNSSSIALNRIFDGNPSRIMGAIEANGQIFLVNQNGFLFGPTARVRTSGLLVSSLNMAESTFDNGLLSPELVRQTRAALESDGRVGVLKPDGTPVLGDDGQPLEVKISIAAGARISTVGKGGRVMIASRTVDNAGEIDTPDGQVILAAGEKVYLQASTNPSLRGLLVEVDAGGEAFNRMTGSISAARGNVTMVGLAVNQEGRISATSTVSANGSIRLLARDTVRRGGDNQNPTFVATHGGRLELGANSQTTVNPELADPATAIDEQAQVPSSIELTGRQVFIRGGAQVRTPGGEISVRAQNEKLEEVDESPFAFDPEARVRVESGAVLDASGSDASASISRNVVRVELRGNELRDAPLQRDGPLRGKEVFIDARVGTPLADVAGALAGIGRAIDERTSAGGTISVKSAGDISVAGGAVFDVSGGTLTYTGGAVQTTQLVTADGRAVDIGQASATGNYVGLINPSSQRRFDRWGVTERVQGPLIGRYETGRAVGRHVAVCGACAGARWKFSRRRHGRAQTTGRGTRTGWRPVDHRGAAGRCRRDAGLFRTLDQPGVAVGADGRGRRCVAASAPARALDRLCHARRLHARRPVQQRRGEHTRSHDADDGTWLGTAHHRASCRSGWERECAWRQPSFRRGGNHRSGQRRVAACRCERRPRVHAGRPGLVEQ